MKAAWGKLSARFALFSRREKIIVAAASVVGAFMVGDALWMTPGQKNYRQGQKQLSEKRDELARLNNEQAVLSGKLVGADAANKAALDAARKELETVSAQLLAFEKALVPAQQMPDFLQSLLPPGGELEVVSLKTLPPEPMVRRVTEAVPGGAAAGKNASPGAAIQTDDSAMANVYRHGVELKLAGSYSALLAYVAALEQSPQKVAWAKLEFNAEHYPRTEMTLVILTLSLDRSWLIV